MDKNTLTIPGNRQKQFMGKTLTSNTTASSYSQTSAHVSLNNHSGSVQDAVSNDLTKQEVPPKVQQDKCNGDEALPASHKTVTINGSSTVLLAMPETVVSMTRAAKKSFKNHVVALRPWSFTASLTPVLLGSTLAYKVYGFFNIWICILVCMTALSVHAAGNLVNTYFDYMKGVDCKKSDDRTLVDNLLSPNDVATMGGIFYFIGCLCFALCSYLSPSKMEHLALIYFGGLSGSFLYTGGLGLKYIALGDLAIFLTFGPVTVLFAYMAQGGTLSWMPILYTIPLALNTEAILHANNTRDMESDKAAGIVTIAIIVGKTGSYLLLTALMFVPYIILACFTMNFSKWFALPLLTVFSAFNIERVLRQKDLAKLPGKIALLNLQLGLLYIVAFLLTEKTLLPGFQ
jgi:1,4-dihydroxy-2-naphthoate octaprenyltransferase